MAHAKHDELKHELAPRGHEFFERFFEDWPEVFRRPFLFWPERWLDTMRVEEFSEGGAFVVRVELPGIDPDKDVEISVVGDMLHIGAERREEEKTEGRDYVRREHRYGSFHRDIPFPKGTSEADIKASYKDGILEVRVPVKKPEPQAVKKISVTKD